MENSHPLHVCRVQRFPLIINRLHTLFHAAALMDLIYCRATNLHLIITKKMSFILPHVLVFASELMLSFLWLLDQACPWRPVSRSVFLKRLRGDDYFPSLDVFICNADPNKDPSVEVMNTVISSMALDYPPEKLLVYLPDVGGSTVTLFAMKEAWKFARSWLPFCRKNGIKTRCPELYFAEDEGCPDRCNRSEFMKEKGEIEKQFNVFKNRVQKFKEKANSVTGNNHPPKIGVVKDAAADALGADQKEMPLLVYVSREKRPSHLHHFKAGALNVLVCAPYPQKEKSKWF